MAKTLAISVGLVALIVLLLFIVQPPTKTLRTVPFEIPNVPAPIEERGQPSPKAPLPDRGQPTPKAQEPEEVPAGISSENLFPSTINFWVNDVNAPETIDYQGANYIPVKKDQVKTFAGSFGPYAEDPSKNLKVVLCAELLKTPAGAQCETMQPIFRDNYVSFAKGYQFDEYIGGFAAKDYIVYYKVYAGDILVANSNKAVVRTIS